MPRTRRRCLELAATVAALPWLPAAAGAAAPRAAAGVLSCRMAALPPAAAGQPARVQVTVANTGGQALHLLVWGTPFDRNWFAPWASLQRDGRALPYGGAMLKRGDPQAADYLRLEPGEQRSATVDLAPAYDATVPGRYRLRPAIVLHDVVVDGQDAVPRPRDRHQGRPLPCDEIAFDVRR